MPKPKPPRSRIQIPIPVQQRAQYLDTWLKAVQLYRQQLSVADRLATLLWSWPIRRAITAAEPRPFLTKKQTRGIKPRDRMDRTTDLERRESEVEIHLPLYAQCWYPFEPPGRSHDTPSDANHRDVCELFCAHLRELDVELPEADNDQASLARFIEDCCGDGRYNDRREEQTRVVGMLGQQDRRQLCEIAERARDQAFLAVQADCHLDMLRNEQGAYGRFTRWVREAANHIPFVEEQLRELADDSIPDKDFPTLAAPIREHLCAFYDAFDVLTTRGRTVSQFLHEAGCTRLDDKSRYVRPRQGKPSRAQWVEPAKQALRRLPIPEPARNTLLYAWSLIPPKR